MAQVLTSSPAARPCEPPAGWWPVDFLILGYLLAGGALVAAFFQRVPYSALVLTLHASGALLVVLAVKAHPDPQAAGRKLQAVFRYWYPLPYVAVCYKEMAILIPAIRGIDRDAEMARLDRALWGVDPTVWLERLQSPALTEFLQIVYFLFIPVVLLVACWLWRQQRYAAFRYYAFLIALGFLVSYVGYFLVPVRGPRFFLAHLQHTELSGLGLFQPLHNLLDRLESAHYDCFPSGHTELTLLAWWSSRRISARLFAALSAHSVCIILATIYLRYHYTVDVLAGGVVALVLLAATPAIYKAGVSHPRGAPR